MRKMPELVHWVNIIRIYAPLHYAKEVRQSNGKGVCPECTTIATIQTIRTGRTEAVTGEGACVTRMQKMPQDGNEVQGD